MQYGLQLYSVRDVAQTDLRAALAQAAKLGYRSVEFAGFFGHPAKDVKTWLEEYGLTVIGTHTGFAELDRDFGGVVRYHEEIGCRLLVIPYTKPETQADCRMIAAKLKEYAARLAREGIALAYHNHAHEFAKVEGGTPLWNALIGIPGLQLELDTFWAYAAGEDPVFWMERLHGEGRLPAIHIKDGLKDGSGKPLGLGEAPVEAVYRAAARLSVPMLAESETLSPSGTDEATICIDYLRKLEGTNA